MLRWYKANRTACCFLGPRLRRNKSPDRGRGIASLTMRCRTEPIACRCFARSAIKLTTVTVTYVRRNSHQTYDLHVQVDMRGRTEFCELRNVAARKCGRITNGARMFTGGRHLSDRSFVENPLTNFLRPSFMEKRFWGNELFFFHRWQLMTVSPAFREMMQCKIPLALSSLVIGLIHWAYWRLDETENYDVEIHECT